MVELTKFDVEDVITTSAMNLDKSARDTAVEDIKAYTGAGNATEAGYGNNVFAW